MCAAMLERPPFSDDAIARVLRDAWGVESVEIAFLPLGADVNSAAFAVTTLADQRWFLKMRRGTVVGPTIEVPYALARSGIAEVVAPVATRTNTPVAPLADFSLALYPFIDGANGFDRPLDSRQLAQLGSAARRIHEAVLPDNLMRALPTETWSDRWRTGLGRRLGETATPPTPVGKKLRELLNAHRETIQRLVARSADLAERLPPRKLPNVLCHADLHGGNVLVGVDGIHIIDWDTPILAPRERDLMFVGGGIAGAWSTEADRASFYAGYGPVEIDPVALAYYRTERIVEDIAVTCDEILDRDADDANAETLFGHLEGQFRPGGVIDIAFATPDGTDA